MRPKLTFAVIGALCLTRSLVAAGGGSLNYSTSAPFPGGVMVHLLYRHDSAYDCDLAPNGELVSVGIGETKKTGYDTTVIRQSPSGKVLKATKVASSGTDMVMGLNIEPDGSFLVAGSRALSSPSAGEFALHRFSSLGSFLSSKFHDPTPGLHDVILDVAEYDDPAVPGVEHIGVGQVAQVGTPDKLIFGVARFKGDNTFDTNFGVKSYAFGTGWSKALEVAIDTQGRIMVAGWVERYASTGAAGSVVARFLPNGDLDQTFNYGTGFVELPQVIMEGHALAIDNVSGNIYVGGGYSGDFRIVSLLDNGTLNSNFGSGGLVIANLGRNEFITSLRLDANGTILAAGGITDTSEGLSLARFTTTGGLLWSRFTPVNKGVPQCIVIDEVSGDFFLGGYAWNSVDSDFLSVKYHWDGSLDTTFKP